MPKSDKQQLDRFKQAAQEAGADMSKEEFEHVIGKIARSEPKVPSSRSDKDKTATK